MYLYCRAPFGGNSIFQAETRESHLTIPHLLLWIVAATISATARTGLHASVKFLHEEGRKIQDRSGEINECLT
jgi:hypothetical protein